MRARVFDNHRGRPTFARRIAEVISKVIDHRQSIGPLPCGIYHRISSGKTSWFGFVQENFLRFFAGGVLGKAPRLRPITIER